MQRAWVALATIALCCGGAVAASGEASAPTLIVESGEEYSQVFVEMERPEGEPLRVLLRQTAAKPTPGRTAASDDGAAAFANWTEEGATFTSFTRDGGQSWTKARRLGTELMLQAGRVAPGATMPVPVSGLEVDASTGVFVVQLASQSLPEWRAALETAGAEIVRSIPYNAHVVQLDPSLTGAIGALDFVSRVEPYHPSYRVEPELVAWIGSAGDDEIQRVRVAAFEWGPSGKERIREYAEGIGATVSAFWPSGYVIELDVTPEQLTKIARLDLVSWIDRWSAPEDDMDLVRQDSGAVSLESSTGRCGQGVRAEVLDSGVDQNHMDFTGILLHNAANVASHGTSTYGIVFGDGTGNAQALGILHCAEQGIFGDYNLLGDRFAYTEELKNPPYEASFQTNSWGSARTTTYTTNSQEMDDIIFNLDIAILQSQSNSGGLPSRPQAWAKNIISVGGVRHFNTLGTGDDAWNNSASIGPASDGRIKPDLSYWYDNIFTTTSVNTYTSGFGGTSAATPMSAGVVGLMIQMWSENVFGTNPVGISVFERQPHAQTIKALAINTANQYTFSGTTADLTRVHQGWGRPNAENLYDLRNKIFVVDEEDALTVGQSTTYQIDVAALEPELKVTMAYRDPAATPGASVHRINDVDLMVTSPGGTVYHGNVGLDAGNYSTPGGGPNSIDTVENVFVDNPAAGIWEVTVTASDVVQDGNPGTPGADVVYALVVSGGVQKTSECGNGILEPGEVCDGADLGGESCGSVGCSGGGTLGCAADCLDYDFTACADAGSCPTCGSGTCEGWESCEFCSECPSLSSVSCGNGVCEAADGEDCLSCPSDCNGQQGGKKGDRYCCGDGATGEGPVTCSDSRCGGFSACISFPAPDACCGDGVCEGQENNTNCSSDCTGPPPPPSCADLGQSCSVDGDCCSNKCKGPSGRKTCK